MSTDDLREQLDLDAIRDRYKKWGHKVAPDSPIADVYRLCDHVTDLRAALDALREENRHLRDQHTRERQSADVARHERDAANAALTAVTDLLDEARMQRDAALRQLEVDHGIPRAVHAAALRAIADLEQQRDNAREEVERLRHYTSTACHHGLHESCGKAQHDRGEDGAPHCKWCPEPCRCVCHEEAS